MKFVLGKEHLQDYYKQGYLLLNNFLEENQLSSLKAGVETALSKRIRHHRTTQSMFLTGRDLWREDEGLRQLVMQRSLAEIAAQLFKSRPLRLGADQLLPALISPDEKYQQFLQIKSIKAAFSLQGILGGALLSLAEGNTIFLSADCPVQTVNLSSTHLLIIYTLPKAFYALNRDDPLTSFLIPRGYTYGERLNDQQNPLILR